MADIIALASSLVQLLDAIKNLTKYVTDVRRSHEERSELFLEIQNLVPLLESLNERIQVTDANDPWVESVSLLRRPGGPIDRVKSILDRLQKNLAPKSSAVAIVKQRLSWSFDKKQLKGWLDETERFKTYLILAIQNDQMLLSRAIKSDTSKVDATVDVVLQDLARLDVSQDGQTSKSRMREVLEWLSPLDFRDRLYNSFQVHIEGSNEWFLNSEIFHSWCVGSTKVLCCDGEAGAGKTILVSQIIDRLKTLYPNYPVLYTFCEYSDRLLKSHRDFISVFLRQLVEFEGKLPEDIHHLYSLYEKQGTRPTIKEMLSLLKAMLEIYPSSFLVIDALDEYYGGQELLLQSIALLQGTSRILFTIRATYLKTWLDNIESLGFISPTGFHFQAAPQDIELYIRNQLPTLPRYFRGDAEMEQLILEQAVSTAAGRFLVAALLINILRDCTTKKEARIVLQRLANQESLQALDQLYEQTLERIQIQDVGFRTLAEKTLGWLAWSFDSLNNVVELQHALAVETATMKLDADNIPEIETIVRACLGMVVFDSVSHVIRFVHYSAATCSRRFYFTQNTPTHCNILEVCLTYLSYDSFKTGPSSNDEEMESRIREYPFILYASKHWGDHARECIENMALVDERCMKLRSTVMEYLKQAENRNAAAQIEYSKSHYHIDSTNYPNDLSALHVAASFGLYSIINLLHADGADINARDSYGCTPLNRASRKGHIYAISLLLQKGANLHIPDNYGQDALHMAAWNGHMDAVEILVDGGAKLNVKDHEGQTAIHKAAAQGNQQIVSYLAKKGADINIRDNLQRSPVELALTGGHDALRWPMLQNWVKYLESDDYRRPPLHQALRHGSIAQVEQILDDGYEIDKLDFWNRTALLEAARCGLKSMTQLLVERGADITIKRPSYFSVPWQENAVALAADSCYVNYYGDKGKLIKEEERRENALAIIQLLLNKLITTYGLVDGLKLSLGNTENQAKISLAATEFSRKRDIEKARDLAAEAVDLNKSNL